MGLYKISGLIQADVEKSLVKKDEGNKFENQFIKLVKLY